MDSKREEKSGKLERETIIRIIKKVEDAKENPFFYLKRLTKKKI